MVATIKRQSAELNIEIEKGSTFSHTLTWKSGVPGGETAVDLTGATAKIQIKSMKRNSTVMYEGTTAGGQITLGGINGTILLTIPAADSASWRFKEGKYNLEIYFPSGEEKRFLRGMIYTFDETINGV